MQDKIKFLFVCNMNTVRSPAAASLFQYSPYHVAKSAGIYKVKSGEGESPLTQELINWADKIFVMEENQKLYLQENFDIKDKFIEVLNVPDIYRLTPIKEYEDLKNILSEKLSAHLKFI